MKRSGTKDFALEQELSIEAESQKGNIVFSQSSMNLTAAEGSRWETADGKLMLRHSMKSVNVVLCSRQKTYRSGQGREVERPDAAQVRSHRVSPPADRTGARKQKRSFLLEGARDARAGWQQLGGGTEAVFFNENTKRMTQQLILAEANKARWNENR